MDALTRKWLTSHASLEGQIQYLSMLKNIMEQGDLVSPRGYQIRELRNYPLYVSPHRPFMDFQARRYPIKYFKAEMRWKLGANPYDETMLKHAGTWHTCRNPDGTWNSNYGQYWFGPQGGFWSVITELVRDRDSRRAVIPMLSKEHMTPETVDTVCTEAVGFHIRDSYLYMTVHMRSSDVIWGLGTDIPTFAFLQRLVFGALNENIPLYLGPITIVSMSSHIYDRHFKLVDSILEGGIEQTIHHHMPYCTSWAEVLYLISSRGKLENVPGQYKLASWLANTEEVDVAS